MSKLYTPFAVFVLASTALTTAQAQDAGTPNLGQHPAIFVRGDLHTIDPNLYIVQPPASVSWVGVHANLEHPAVLVARRAATIDSNSFQVQPPASVTWKRLPADDASQWMASTSH